MQVIKNFLLILFCVSIISCQQNKKTSEVAITDSTKVSYAPPKAPTHIEGDEGKINYVFNHFWDNFNFRDTVKIFDPQYGEQAIADYIGYFPLVRLDTLAEGIESVFNEAKIEPSVFEFFKFQFENYLSNPNSPMRNDEYYEKVVEYLISSGKVTPDDKIKYETLLPLLKKNKPGSIATDFNYLSVDGNNSKFSTIESPFTLLIFYEPGCSNCEETIEQIKANPGFNSVVDKGALKIVAIYPDGNIDIWKNYQKNIPSNWINGVDVKQEILNKGLYIIKATPTIYLMDKDKKVILKDTNLNQVIQFFQNI